MSEKKILLEMLKEAYDVEKKGSKIFAHMAGKARDNRVKRLFERLALEEQDHMRLISKMIFYLENKAEWKTEDLPEGIGKVKIIEMPEIDPFGGSGLLTSKPDISIQKTLREAYDIEKRQYDFFKRILPSFDEMVARDILIYLANEERKHAMDLAEEHNRIISQKK